MGLATHVLHILRVDPAQYERVPLDPEGAGGAPRNPEEPRGAPRDHEGGRGVPRGPEGHRDNTTTTHAHNTSTRVGDGPRATARGTRPAASRQLCAPSGASKMCEILRRQRQATILDLRARRSSILLVAGALVFYTFWGFAGGAETLRAPAPPL